MYTQLLYKFYTNYLPGLYLPNLTSLLAYRFVYTSHFIFNSPPKPHAFTSLPLQSMFDDILSINYAIALVNDSNKSTRSLEDRVDCYMNGILTYYFPWQTNRFENGEWIKAGNIIAPQSWTHEFTGPGWRKPDFTLSYLDENIAEDPFDFLWVECKRPFESFFEALDQVSAAIYFRRSFVGSPGGLYGGFIIVVVGKEMAFFEVPLTTNRDFDVTWHTVLPLRPRGIDLSQARPLYVSDEDNLPRIGDIWHVDKHQYVIHNMLLTIRAHTKLRIY